MRPVRHPGVVRGWTRSAILRTIVTGAVLMASASLVYLSARLWDSPVTAAPASAPGSRGEASASSEAGYERFVIEPAESQALYRVGEVFLNVNRPNVAVGVTQAIRGEILIDPRRLANSRLGTIQVDISQLTSDQPRRDQAIRERWLESARFPIAEFRVSSVEGLPDAYHEGVAVPVTLHGQLKIRTVERPVTFQGSFVLADNTLKGTARTTIRMTDFGFDPPSILGLLRAENEAEIQVEIVARRVG